MEDYWENKGKPRHSPETAMYVCSFGFLFVETFFVEDGWDKRAMEAQFAPYQPE